MTGISHRRPCTRQIRAHGITEPEVGHRPWHVRGRLTLATMAQRDRLHDRALEGDRLAGPEVECGHHALVEGLVLLIRPWRGEHADDLAVPVQPPSGRDAVFAFHPVDRRRDAEVRAEGHPERAVPQAPEPCQSRLPPSGLCSPCR